MRSAILECDARVHSGCGGDARYAFAVGREDGDDQVICERDASCVDGHFARQRGQCEIKIRAADHPHGDAIGRRRKLRGPQVHPVFPLGDEPKRIRGRVENREGRGFFAGLAVAAHDVDRSGERIGVLRDHFAVLTVFEAVAKIDTLEVFEESARSEGAVDIETTFVRRKELSAEVNLAIKSRAVPSTGMSADWGDHCREEDRKRKEIPLRSHVCPLG